MIKTTFVWLVAMSGLMAETPLDTTGPSVKLGYGDPHPLFVHPLVLIVAVVLFVALQAVRLKLRRSPAQRAPRAPRRNQGHPRNGRRASADGYATTR